MAEINIPQQVIASELKVSLGSVGDWTSDIIQRKQRSRDDKVWWLDLLGWTKEEIAQKLDLPPTTVRDSRSNISELKKSTKPSSLGATPRRRLARSQNVSFFEIGQVYGGTNGRSAPHVIDQISPLKFGAGPIMGGVGLTNMSGLKMEKRCGGRIRYQGGYPCVPDFGFRGPVTVGRRGGAGAGAGGPAGGGPGGKGGGRRPWPRGEGPGVRGCTRPRPYL